jgi:F-type H+-transporting ATPase subunit delta
MTAASEKRKIAERYVTALFELAETENTLERVEQDFADLTELLAGSDELRRLCLNQSLSPATQHHGIRLVVEKAGFSLLTGRFLMLLAQKRRISLIFDIMQGFTTMLQKHRGQATAVITGAGKLKKAQTEKIAKVLQKFTGKEIVVETKQDASILGGVKVYCDGLLMDATLNGKLDRLSDNLYQKIRQLG